MTTALPRSLSLYLKIQLEHSANGLFFMLRIKQFFLLLLPMCNLLLFTSSTF